MCGLTAANEPGAWAVAVGQTALHFAAEKGHTEVAQQLLSAGADPSVADQVPVPAETASPFVISLPLPRSVDSVLSPS